MTFRSILGALRQLTKDSWHWYIRNGIQMMARATTDPIITAEQCRTIERQSPISVAVIERPRRVEGIRGSLRDTKVNKRKKSLARLRA